MVSTVKRLFAVLFLLMYALHAVPAQSWYRYLPDDAAREVREHILAAGESLELLHETRVRSVQALRDLYVRARQQQLSPSEYLTEWETGVESGDIPLAPHRAALERYEAALNAVREAIAGSPPPVGTSAYAGAQQWLRHGLAAHGGDPREVEALVARARISSQAAGDARRVIDLLGIPLPAEYRNASPADQLLQAIGSWWLIFLAGPRDADRADSLRELGLAMGAVDPALETEVTTVSLSYRVAAAEKASAAAAFLDARPYLNAAGIIGELSAGAGLGAFLESLSRLRRTDLNSLCRTDPAFLFGIETLEHLLRSLSSPQRVRLALRAGLPPSEVERLRGMLYRVRLDVESDSINDAERGMAAARESYRTDAAADDAEVLALFRLEGESFVSGLSPWLDGSSGSGDAYRWAMLSVLSNPYSQHRILNDPERIAEQRLVASFARVLYERFEDEVGARIVDLERVSGPESVESFDRSYAIPGDVDGSVSAAVYRAFFDIAQGDELMGGVVGAGELPPDVVIAWARAHGLTLIRGGAAEDGAAAAAGPAAGVEPGGSAKSPAARAAVWFDLANAAETDVQATGYALRGMSALGGELRAAVLPILVDSGVPSAVIYDPRVDLALGLLDREKLFEVPPQETMRVLRALYPGFFTIDQLFDAILSSATAVADQVRDIEYADRRVTRGGAPR